MMQILDTSARPAARMTWHRAWRILFIALTGSLSGCSLGAKFSLAGGGDDEPRESRAAPARSPAPRSEPTPEVTRVAEADSSSEAMRLCQRFAGNMLRRVEKDPITWSTNPGQFERSCLKGDKADAIRDEAGFDDLVAAHRQAVAMVERAQAERVAERKREDAQRDADYEAQKQARRQRERDEQRARLEERAKSGHPHDQLVDAAACAEHGELHAEHELDASLADQIAVLACNGRLGWVNKSGITEDYPFTRLHFAFDDRHYDHLKAAMILVSCVAYGECAANQEERYRDNKIYSPVAVGMASYYASHTKRARLRKALAKVSADEDVKGGFLHRFDLAVAHVSKLAEALDPRRQHLYVDVPNRVRAARRRHWKAHAKLYAAYDAVAPKVASAIEGGRPSSALVAKVRSIRESYVRRCSKKKELAACVRGPLGRPLTEAMVRLAIARRDPVLAKAENSLLELGAEEASAATQIFLAQYTAIEEESRRHAKYERAKDKGVDERTLKSMFGSPPPINVSTLAALRPPKGESGYGPIIEELGGEVDHEFGVVRSVKRRGKKARITFRPEVTKWDEMNCRDTNRIDRITTDGRVLYRQKCKYRKTHTKRRRIKPVTVPARDAAKLRAGNLVLVAFDGRRRGYVQKVFASGKRRKVIQLRGMR